MTSGLRVSLLLVLFFSIFNFTTSIIADPYIVSELGGSSFIGIYAITFFGAGNLTTLPLAAEFNARFGGVRVLFIFLLFFILFTFLSGISTTFVMFVVMRYFSGVFSGVFFTLCFALINLHATEEVSQKNLSLMAAITTITPSLSASYGGFLAYDLSWSLIFFIQLPFLVGLACILYHHREPALYTISKPFDFAGYLSYFFAMLSGIAICALGQQLDWFRSKLISWLVGIGSVSFLFFCVWECLHENPLIHLRILKIPIVSLSFICLFFLYSAYFGMVVLLALWLHLDANYTPLWIAVLIAHMTFASSVLYVILRKWFVQTSSLWVVLLSTAFFGISCFYSSTFNAEIDFGRLAFSRILAGFGLAFFLFPLLLNCINCVKKEECAPAVGILQISRILAGSLGCAGYTTLWYRRRVFYYTRLGSEYTEYSDLMKQYLSRAEEFVIDVEHRGVALLERALEVQSDALALADCFHLMGWIMTGVFVMTLSYLALEYFQKKYSKRAI